VKIIFITSLPHHPTVTSSLPKLLLNIPSDILGDLGLLVSWTLTTSGILGKTFIFGWTKV
jgi:hypothetical protein